MINEHFMELFDEAKDCIFVAELDNGKAQRFIEVNEIACNLLGYTREEMLHLPPDSLTNMEEKEIERLHEKFLKEKKITYETSYLTKNGSEIPIEANNRIIETDGKSYMLIIARDISDRKQIERELFETEHHFQLLLNHINEIFWIRSIDFSLCQYVSPAFEEITGYPKEFLYRDPKWFLTIVHPGDRDKLKRIVLENKEETFTVEYRIYRADGSLAWVRERGFVIQNGIMEQEYYIGITEDITELKENEILQKKSEKLATIGLLSAGLAHEIRNPLTSVKGFLQLLKHEYEDNPTHMHFHHIIFNELDRVEKIINDYLVLAQPQELNFQPYHLMELISEVIESFNSVAYEKNIHFNIVSTLDNPLMMFEWDKMQQVFQNIFQNSIDAMPDGGDITIEVDPMADHSIQIKVTDTGEGIAPDRILKLGEPYFSTKEKGTGLGLMISYKIIENHNGKIDVSSKVNRGTTVTITMPIRQSNH